MCALEPISLPELVFTQLNRPHVVYKPDPVPPCVFQQRYADTRFEEQRQLYLPQKHKATDQNSTLQWR